MSLPMPGLWYSHIIFAAGCNTCTYLHLAKVNSSSGINGNSSCQCDHGFVFSRSCVNNNLDAYLACAAGVVGMSFKQSSLCSIGQAVLTFGLLKVK